MASNKNRRIFGQKKRRSPVKRLLKRIALLGLILFIGAGVLVYAVLSGSLPTYDGQVESPSLKSAVTIERDQIGTVKITANDRLSLSYALGFSHAQDRFFQMDLLRRSAAGELSELFGSIALDRDKAIRTHLFRQRAQTIIEQLPETELAILQAYVDGVNFGLKALSTSPFEYYLLQTEPEPWKQTDSILAVYAMYLDLQQRGIERERVLSASKQTLSSAEFEFLFPSYGPFDAPLDNSTYERFAPIDELKSSIEIEQTQTNARLQNNSKSQDYSFSQDDGENNPGSNNFAITKQRALYNSSIVAGDMHLGLNVPNIWYKVNLHFQQNQKAVNLYGVTLPGAPLLIAGTNDYIAWTFTNSYGDYLDVVELEQSDENTDVYLLDGKKFSIEEKTESLAIKNESSITHTLLYTDLGPVIERMEDKIRVLVWVAHQPNAINFNLRELELSNTTKDALDIATRTSIPAQNILVGDRNGDIGWTIIGPLPSRKEQHDGITTIDVSAEGRINWLSKTDYPMVINGDHQALWTANSRVIGSGDLAKVGDGGYANGIRSHIIKKQLMKVSNASENDLLAIQLSTDAELYEKWREHLLQQLQQWQDLSDLEQQTMNFINQWNGRSDIDQVGFSILKRYRSRLSETILEPLKNKLPTTSRSFRSLSRQYETLLWRLIDDQPLKRLPKPFSSYSDLYRTTLNDVLDNFTENNDVLADQTWGSLNKLNIHHPISRAVPFLSSLLDPPQYSMPGDSLSPRVQTPRFGASQRMVIAPGHIDNAIFHMPGGQSGHPLSPFYEKGFEDWVAGEATPLKAQAPVHTLTLTPPLEP